MTKIAATMAMASSASFFRVLMFADHKMGSDAVQQTGSEIARANKRKSGLLHHLDGRLRDKRKPDPERRAAVIPIFGRPTGPGHEWPVVPASA